MMPFIHISHYLIPTFFIVISLGLSLLLYYLSYRVSQFKKDRKTAFNIVLVLMISGFIGGRLMHVIYEEPSYYIENPWQVFSFWNGGFVFFGGLLLSWLSVWGYCRWMRLSFLDWADFYTPILSLGHAVGRLGCLMAGCCFGSYCRLPWSIDGRHPAPLYLIFGEFVILALILSFERYFRNQKISIPKGIFFFVWLLLHSIIRFFVEFIRDDFRGLFWKFPILGDLSISQMISLVLIITALIQLIRYLKNSERI